jgi:exosortase A
MCEPQAIDRPAAPRRGPDPAAPRGAAIGSPVWLVALICLAVVSIALLDMYWSAAASAVAVWYNSRAYNHGFLILPIVCYLLFERRRNLGALTPAPWPWALLLLLPAGVGWLIAKLVGIVEGQQLMLVVSLQAILLAVLGRRIYHVLRFPFLYLFFLVPTGDFLVPYLQDFTAWFVVTALRLSNVPVYSDGYLIAIPNSSFYVAEACAGLRFLIAMIALGFLFADFTFRSTLRKACFVALCVVVPVVANGIRAYGIVLIAYLANDQLAVDTDHILYGWLFFAIVMVSLIFVGARFHDGRAERDRPAMPSAPAGPPGRLVAVAMAGLLLTALPRAYVAYLDSRPAESFGSLALPQVAMPWIADAAPGDWHPSFPGADLTAQGGFRNGGKRVELFIAYYVRQTDDRKLVSAANSILGDGDGDVLARSTMMLKIGDGLVPVTATQISLPGRKRRMVLSVYWVADRFETDPIKAKLLEARSELLAGRREAAFVAFSTDLDSDPAPDMATLADFAAHLPPLAPTLRAVVGH